jgi:hypothetical protein
MCDKCITASTRLSEMLTQLENEFPATEVRGEKVDRDHHVTVAVLAEAEKRYTSIVMKQLGAADVDQLLGSMFGGGKISEGN